VARTEARSEARFILRSTTNRDHSGRRQLDGQTVRQIEGRGILAISGNTASVDEDRAVQYLWSPADRGTPQIWRAAGVQSDRWESLRCRVWNAFGRIGRLARGLIHGQPGIDTLDAGLMLPVEHEFVRRINNLSVVE
jgi:hypothetical protein